MTLALFAAFWAVSILLVITPGMDWAYVISAGIRGRVGALLVGNPLALTALTLLGAAYLLWIGFNMLLHPPVPGAGEDQRSDSWLRWAGKGVCVSGLNPKVFLLFLALLPQFTDARAEWSVPMQMLALGAVHLISCGLVYLLVGFGSQSVLRTRPQAAKGVGRISGAAMIVIALGLLAEQALK
ncbi:putative threonine efflux protein [Acinetobacter baumannii]|nr:putative threonine efflux protein [Acinetobacter baumannii]